MTRRTTCLRCGTSEGVASYRLCDPCASARLADERQAQGLPSKVTDGPTIERVITIAGLAPASSSSAGASAVHPAGGGLGRAGSTAAAPAGAPRRTSDGTADAPVTTRSTRRLAAAGTKNSATTEVALHDAAAPDFAAS